jgi:hypothetical protein
MKTIIITIFLCTTLTVYLFSSKLFSKIFNLSLSVLNILEKDSDIAKLIAKLINKLLSSNPNIKLGVEILEAEYIKEVESLEINIQNVDCLPYYKLLPTIFFKLQTFPLFKEFADNKIIMSNAYSLSGSSFALHNNFLINNHVIVLDFFKHYQPNLHYLSTVSYNINNIEFVHIRAWNVDEFKNKHIKITQEDKAKLDKIINDTINDISQSNNLNIVLTNSTILNNMRYASFNNIIK